MWVPNLLSIQSSETWLTILLTHVLGTPVSVFPLSKSQSIHLMGFLRGRGGGGTPVVLLLYQYINFKDDVILITSVVFIFKRIFCLHDIFDSLNFFERTICEFIDDEVVMTSICYWSDDVTMSFEHESCHHFLSPISIAVGGIRKEWKEYKRFVLTILSFVFPLP